MSYKNKLVDGGILLKFTAEIYGVQMALGRHFLHEHTVGASSWQETCIKKVAQDSRVGVPIAHLCQYGMQSVDNNRVKHAVRKSTRFMSTSKLALDQLETHAKENVNINISLTEGRKQLPSIPHNYAEQ